MSAPAVARVRVEFFEADHSYLLNGSESFSVTQALEAEGLSGCLFYKETDRQRGSAVHKIALLLSKRPIRGATVEEVVANSAWDPATTHPMLVPYGMAAAAYLLESGFRPERVERPTGSLVYGVCGTPDAWGTLPNGKKRLVDYKSGQPQPAADLQTALYAMMLAEAEGLQVDERQVVWLKPDGTYKAYPPKPPGGLDLSIGLAAVNLYKWRRKFNKL